MNIGIIGAGKVGVSVGRYLKDNNIQISGFYDTAPDNAAFAAQFTQTDCFSELNKLVKVSDTLFITTPDNVIGSVWDCIKNKNMSVNNKIVCHFSGALSSDVFTDSQSAGASVCSVHPLLAFSDKLTSYRIPANTFLLLREMKQLFRL
ncbi:MAG: Gfo/Idh/MocA family oxidoreductase [Ruminococcus sp.]